MKLSEILAISGAPGLHKYVAQGRGGIIVESLADAKRTMVNGAAKVSALGDIAVFTDAEEVPLADIFTAIYKANKGPVAINGKSTNDELDKFFATVLPKYDRDRVHMSDVKKIASWYNILVGTGMTKFVNDEDEAPAVAEQDAKEKAADGTAPAKKAAAKKPAAPKTGVAKAATSPKAAGAKVVTSKATVRKSQ